MLRLGRSEFENLHKSSIFPKKDEEREREAERKGEREEGREREREEEREREREGVFGTHLQRLWIIM